MGTENTQTGTADPLAVLTQVAADAYFTKLASYNLVRSPSPEEAMKWRVLGDNVHAAVTSVAHELENQPHGGVKQAVDSAVGGQKPEAQTKDQVKSASEYLKLPGVRDAALLLLAAAKTQEGK